MRALHVRIPESTWEKLEREREVFNREHGLSLSLSDWTRYLLERVRYVAPGKAEK